MTDENKAIIVLPDLTAVDLYTAEKMDILLEAIRDKVEKVVLPDTSTDKNRKEIIAYAFEVTQANAMIQKGRLKITEGWRKDTKTVNQAGKTAEEFLKQLAKDTRESVTDWEASEEIRKAEELRIEQERVENIRKIIGGMSDNLITCVGKTSIEIQEVIYSVDDLQVTDEAFEEFKDAAWTAKEETIKKLRSMRDAIQLQEEEADRLAKEKEKLAKEEVERQKKIKTENERLKADAARIAESNKKLEAEKKSVAADRKEVNTHLDELTQAPPRVTEPVETPETPELPADVDIGAPVDTKEAALISLAIAVGEDAAENLLDMIIAGDIEYIRFTG